MMRAIHLLVTAYSIDPNGGSEEGNAWRWVEGALESGHQVTLVTRPQYVSSIETKYLENSHWNLIVRPKPDSNLGIKLPSAIDLYVRYYLWQRSISRLFSEDERNSFDCGHHTSWGSFTLGSGLADLGIPYIFGPCGFISPKKQARPYFGKAWKIEKLRLLAEKLIFSKLSFVRRGLANASVALAGNSEARRQAESLGAKDVRDFLPEGIDDSLIVDEPQAGIVSQEIVWVARFMPRKAASLAIDAFAIVLEDYPAAKLVMVGDGPTFGAAQDQVDAMNLRHAVEFTGRLAWNEVQHKYLHARAFLFSSLRDSTGAQVLEAAAKGLPIIGLYTTGIPEWLPKGAGFFGETQNGPLEKVLAQQIVCVLNLSDAELF